MSGHPCQFPAPPADWCAQIFSRALDVEAPPVLRESCKSSASATARSAVTFHAVYQLCASPSSMTFTVSRISLSLTQLETMHPAVTNASDWDVGLPAV